MRRGRWLSLCGLVLAGCVGVDAPPNEFDIPPVPLEKLGKPPFSTATADMTTEVETSEKPVAAIAVAPRKAPELNPLAKCLPAGLNLSMTVYPPDGPPFALEKRLAELGARRRADGAIVDVKGNVIYHRPPGVPSSEIALAPTDQTKTAEAEGRALVERLLTPDQLARWHANGRETRLQWSFEKDRFDLMLFPADFGVLPAPPTPRAPSAILQAPKSRE